MASKMRSKSRAAKVLKAVTAQSHGAVLENAPPSDQDTAFADKYHGARVHVEDVLGVGAGSFGGSAAAWLSELGTWPKSMVEKVLQNPLTPMVVRSAARRVLGADQKGFVGGKEFDRVCDRTSGKPHQSTRVRGRHEQTAADLLAEARAMLPTSNRLVSSAITEKVAD